MSFISARNRQQAYDLLVREFKRSGLSQAELARRVDMPPEVISRMLKRPRNVEIDTLSKLIYGLTGAALVFGTALPKPRPRRVAAHLAALRAANE